VIRYLKNIQNKTELIKYEACMFCPVLDRSTMMINTEGGRSYSKWNILVLSSMVHTFTGNISFSLMEKYLLRNDIEMIPLN